KLFFSARRSTEPRSTVYAASAVKAEPARAIYSDDNPAWLSDVSSDGRWVLVRRFPSNAENYLIRIDAATGDARLLYPPAGQRLSIFDAAFSADDRQVYVATDLGGEQSVLLAL